MSLTTLYKLIRDDFDKSTERGRIGRAAAGTALFKLASILFALLISIACARSLGPQSYGEYAFVMAWVAIIALPCGLGIPSYLIREAARRPRNAWTLFKWSNRTVVLSGFVAAALLGIASLASGHTLGQLFALAIPLPLLANAASVRQSLLQARGKIAESQWPQLALSPAILLASVCLYLACIGPLTPIILMGITLAVAPIPFLVNRIQLSAVDFATGQEPGQPPSVRAALPFMWLGALSLVNSRVDLIAIGVLRGAHEAGVYAISARAAELIPFFLTVANTSLGPKISELYGSRNSRLLQQITSSAARRIFIVTTAGGATLFLLAGVLVSALYGVAYAESVLPLRILIVAHLVTMLFGPVGILLNMTAHAKQSAMAFGLSAALNILLNLALIPAFGMAGAAVATALSTVFCGALRWTLVRRYLGLRADVASGVPVLVNGDSRL